MTDERFIPGTSRITEMESFHRYLAAAELCRGKRVLDVASGEGYGSKLLAAAAAAVVGADICAEAVEQAAKKYAASNLSFVCADAYALPFPDGEFDRVVSFETIEHLEDPARLLAEIRRVLKPSGAVVLSSPNKTAFDRRNHNEHGENPFHKSEMERNELVATVRRFFPNVAVYAQDSFFNSQIGGASAMRYFVRGGGGIIRQSALKKAQYSIVVAGAGRLPAVPASSFIDADFDERYGYQPDDEAIVNQFGLRGEYERATAELAAKREELEAARRETEELRRTSREEGDDLRRMLDDARVARQLAERRAEETGKTLADECAAHAALQSEHEEQGRELAEERAARTALQSEHERQGQELADERAAHTALQSEHERQGRELAEERAAHAALQSEHERQGQELAEERAAHAALQSEHERQGRELAEERAARTALQSEHERQGQELADERAAHTALQSEHEEQGKELAEERAAHAALQSEHERQGRELAEERTAHAALQDEYEERGKELADERAAHAVLRREHERLGRKFAAVSENAASLRRTLDATSTKLAASRLETARLEANLEEERGAAAARIAELTRQLTEEHAKSEYLWGEWNKLKNTWAVRFYVKLNRMLQAMGRGVCRCGKGMLALFGIRWETRLKFRDLIYRRFGFCLKSVRSYNDWLMVRKFVSELILTPGAGLEVPADLPLTSIVIPVYDNLEYTLNCLHSIYAVNSKAPFEVIVVDDCSTEDYSVLHREYPLVRLIRNERNLGFLRTVNRGVSEAAGEYVLILNNDTEVLPAWLDELATALYHHPEAGMIGSQLIHMRTGTLQESGNLICRDGGMLPLGRGCPPDHPEFSYFREVDFVSAASIILRKSVFDEMHGFDESYAPAYYEDPDLGLRLQQAGYKNYVLPLSRVLHVEMASYGDSFNTRSEPNRRFFCDRWRDYLARHALYDTPQQFFENRKFPHERILYIDAETPMADRGSGGMDAIFFMNYFLKRGFDVVFHGEYTPGCVPKYTEILLRMGVECVYQPYRAVWEYLGSCGWTFSWLFVSRIYQAQCFDRLLKKHCPQAHYIFDTVDLHFVREHLEAELHDDPRMRKQAARTKEFELAVARSADATIVISRDEKKLLENEYGLTNVWHIPQARAIAGRKEGTRRRGAVFIGSAHPPNMDGLRYFHDEILPLLPPDFTLTVVGEALRDVMSRSPEYRDLLKCRKFNFVGFVRELGDVLDTARLTVAPLRYGAGTKGKVASSMSYGVPCVSSDFGVEGTGMVQGENILLAHTPEEFAAAIVKLCTDDVLWKKISDGGLDFLESEYAPGKVEAEMDELIAEVRRKCAGVVLGAWADTPVIPKQDELEPIE